MKKIALTAGMAALAFAQPAWAQDAVEQIEPDVGIAFEEGGETDGEGEEGMDAMAMAMVTALIASMFQADPLDAEAEARLPAANAVAASLVPQGVYGEMMGQMMDSFMGPIFQMAEMAGGMDGAELATYTGLSTDQTGTLSDEARAELTDIFDPVYDTRNRAELDAITEGMNAIFTMLEPGMRDGLARAYASRFDAGELAQLQAFFATPAGAKYASQSLVINTDRQVISGMMQSIPMMMEQLPALLESFENAEAGLPEPRRYDDLTPSEQRRASELLGVDQVTLRERMAEAEMNAAAMEMEEAAGEVEEAMEEPEEETESFEEAMEDLGEG
tara:strand:+ start:240 stop:1232 length:993 start_codon:yes stop_codon:yes gene_type:complete